MNFFLLTLVVLMSIMYSCTKEEISENTLDNSSNVIETRSSLTNETVLGQKLPNPFEIGNMQNAFSSLYGSGGSNLIPTHTYIRFEPQNYKELRNLYSSGLPLFDYPLDYEVNSEGIYYKDPNIQAGQPPYLYTTIEVGQSIPNIQYTVMQDLYIPLEDEALSIKAFELIGKNATEASYVLNENGSLIETEGGGDGEYPGPGWVPPGNGGPSTEGEEDPLILSTNCYLGSGHERKPRVCLSVEDTQFSNANDCGTYMAVRNVKVIFKSIGTPVVFEKYTNHEGATYFSNKLYGSWKMYVEFQNPYCTIIGLEDFNVGNMLDFAKPVKDYVGVFSKPFNDISVCYDNSTDNGSQAFRYWRAATLNNSVFEYLIWCSKEWVTQPLEDLVIVGTNQDNSGAAPMLDKIFEVEDPLFGISGAIFNIVQAESWFASKLIQNFSPDIVMNTLGMEGETDAIKEIMYHELAHASHFTELGYPTNAVPYWVANINYIIANAGYGDGMASGAGRAAVIENWGWSIGSVIADEAYGLNHSNGGLIEANRWINIRESNMFVNGFIQSGLCLDICDHNLPNDLFEHPTIGTNDNMHAWTTTPYREIIKVMTSNVTTVPQFRDNLRLNIPSIYVSDYDLLMQQYGL